MASEQHDQNKMQDGSEAEIREQDRFLPIANITRIMKRSLGQNAKISKDAKETIQECVSEFISFITSEASDRCAQEKRKTINGDDIIFAMQTLGFDNYIEPLKLYLARYRESSNPKGEKSQGKEDKELSNHQLQELQHPAVQQAMYPHFSYPVNMQPQM